MSSAVQSKCDASAFYSAPESRIKTAKIAEKNMLISNVNKSAAYLNNHSVENSSLQTASQSVSAKDILNKNGISSSKVSDPG